MRTQKVAATLSSSTSSGHGSQTQAVKAVAVFDANNELNGFQTCFLMAFTFCVSEFWGYIEKNLLVFSVLNAWLSIF